MGETTSIAWTHSTINVWHGCTKVSSGCTNCYAEVSTPVRVKRARGLEVWGPKAARSETKSWRSDLRKWNRQTLDASKATGRSIVHRVFAQSLADTFEDYTGGMVVRADGRTIALLADLRAEFFAAIEAAPALTFQLLTKRPENVLRMVPASWRAKWPAHVWIGTTAEDQPNADLRIPHLRAVPAPVRFLSVEPQIARAAPDLDGIAWVIQGGESGGRARPFDLAWARSLRDQCRASGVPYFLKQLGTRAVGDWQPHPTSSTVNLKRYEWRLADSHGADESEWPADLRGCRAFPEVPRG